MAVGSGGQASPVSFLVTSLAIASWYTSNIGVLLLNKYLLSSTGFHYPVFLTLCHMLASLLIGVLASFSRFLPLKPIKSRQQAYKIIVLSAVFCTTVVLGNVSLKFIPVSFNQAIGKRHVRVIVAIGCMWSEQSHGVRGCENELPQEGHVYGGTGRGHQTESRAVSV